MALETLPPVELYLTCGAFADATGVLAKLAIRPEAVYVARDAAQDPHFGEHGISVVIRAPEDPPMNEKEPPILVRAAHLGEETAHTTRILMLGNSQILDMVAGSWDPEQLDKAFRAAVVQPAEQQREAERVNTAGVRIGAGAIAFGTEAVVGGAYHNHLLGVALGGLVVALHTIDERRSRARTAHELAMLHASFGDEDVRLFEVKLADSAPE